MASSNIALAFSTSFSVEFCSLISAAFFKFFFLRLPDSSVNWIIPPTIAISTMIPYRKIGLSSSASVAIASPASTPPITLVTTIMIGSTNFSASNAMTRPIARHTPRKIQSCGFTNSIAMYVPDRSASKNIPKR